MQIPTGYSVDLFLLFSWFGDYRSLRFLCVYFGRRTFFMWWDSMEGFASVLVIGFIIGIIIYFTKKKKKEKEEQEENERIIAEEIRKKEEVRKKEMWEKKKREFSSTGLPIIKVETLRLTKNEVCHFAGEACFCKIKTQTTGYEGGSRGVSLRVMKGVSFRVGNYKGHYIKEDITEKTNGVIYLTNKKIIFTAFKNSSIIKYENIISLDAHEDMLQIQTEKTTYLFQIGDSFLFMVILEQIINERDDNSALS